MPFESVWATFLGIFLERLFSSKYDILHKNRLKMEPKWGLVGPTFQKKCENEKVCLDCAGAYGLHMSPSLEAPDATQNNEKKHMCFKYAFFS